TYTDGDTVQQTVSGVPFTLISIPLRYMHSSVEVGNWQDLAWCIDLIAEFLVRIDKEFDFRPIKA
ncbi:MAG: M42 family peptidase, partial [Clostridia bacterium]|nr:M42 family peptidase [Clostridia bacterium]